MLNTLEQSTDPSSRVDTLWRKALAEPTSEAREAAAWEVFAAAGSGLSSLPVSKSYELPAEVRPLLMAARYRATGRSPLDALAQLSLTSDENVQKAVARALVRLSLADGDWD